MSSTRPGGVSCPRRPAAATRLHHLRGSNRRQNGQRHPAPHSLITDRQLRCHQCVYSTVNKTSSTTTSTALLFYLSSSSSSSSSCHSPATTGAPHLRARTLPPPHPLPPAIRRHLVNVGCLPSALSPSSLSVSCLTSFIRVAFQRTTPLHAPTPNPSGFFSREVIFE